MLHHLYDIGTYRISVDTSRTNDRFRVIDRSSPNQMTWFSDLVNAIVETEQRSGSKELKEVPLPVFAGTSVICSESNRLLVGIRGQEVGHGRGFLSFPGGKLDYGTDTDTAEAGKREFIDEVGRECCIVRRDSRPGGGNMHPELFTTNCFMEADGVHYVTFYMMARALWDFSANERIPGREPTKCATWEWWSVPKIIGFLLDGSVEEREWTEVKNRINEIDPAKLQWMPVRHILAHHFQLGVHP